MFGFSKREYASQPNTPYGEDSSYSLSLNIPASPPMSHLQSSEEVLNEEINHANEQQQVYGGYDYSQQHSSTYNNVSQGYDQKKSVFMPQNNQSTIPIYMPQQLQQQRNANDIPMPIIQNIVSTCNVGTPLDLKKIAMHARNAEYNPKRFSAVVMRIREPRTTALIFSSGKMVVTGAKSEDGSRLAARKYARIIQRLGFNVHFSDFKIQNLVGSVDVHFAIQLEGLCVTHNQFSSYEPELFPGLIYRMVKPRVVLLIFVSGKIVITGAKTRDEIAEAFNQIYPIVRGFKK